MERLVPVVTDPPFAVFLDLDGVFADFDAGVRELTGKGPGELDKRRMWAAVHSKKDFFLALALLDGADVLWAYFKQYKPTFLTGAPSSHAFREQKVQWVSEKFGPEWTTIVLPRRDKQLHSGPNKVLVDDNDELIEQWVAKGGFGFLYRGDPLETIEAVEELRMAVR
jgi:hypothetical protein